MMATRALLRCGLLAALAVLFGASPGFADTTWQDVWNSESTSKRISLQGRAKTVALTEKGEEHATALIRAAGGKLRLDYEKEDHHWSLVDDGSRLIRLHPSKRSATFMPRMEMAVDRALAERNYRARPVGRATIAGRQTRVIEIAPRRGGLVAWRLWLDRATGFALKRERYNVDGKLISGTEFTSVQFKAAIPPDIFAVPSGWETSEKGGSGERYSLIDLARHLGFPVVAPSYLPPGYVLQGGYAEQRGEHKRLTAALRYTDGLRVLSIYQRPHQEHEGDRGRGGDRPEGDSDKERGGDADRHHLDAGKVADHGGEKVLRHFSKARVVVVVGDLTADQLTRIAASLD
jgi:outer membrane lipoprotein-sorting protein